MGKIKRHAFFKMT